MQAYPCHAIFRACWVPFYFVTILGAFSRPKTIYLGAIGAIDVYGEQRAPICKGESEKLVG